MRRKDEVLQEDEKLAGQGRGKRSRRNSFKKIGQHVQGAGKEESMQHSVTCRECS